jgi:hypothetical protein
MAGRLSKNRRPGAAKATFSAGLKTERGCVADRPQHLAIAKAALTEMVSAIPETKKPLREWF